MGLRIPMKLLFLGSDSESLIGNFEVAVVVVVTVVLAAAVVVAVVVVVALAVEDNESVTFIKCSGNIFLLISTSCFI